MTATLFELNHFFIGEWLNIDRIMPFTARAIMRFEFGWPICAVFSADISTRRGRGSRTMPLNHC